ncbi:MAG: site-specific integrase, partial [bacterium]|nr:site-specific integrase [bacterium]
MTQTELQKTLQHLFQYNAEPTQQVYQYWILRYADFLQMNPLPEASPDEKLHQFLLAEGKNFSASTINQIVSAIRRFYRETEGITIKPFHAKTPQRLIEELPVSLVNQVIDSLPLPHSLMAILLAGSGLNLADCLSLRTQNIQQSRFVWPLYSPI